MSQIHPRAAEFLRLRAKSQAVGDTNHVRCMNVELARMGYREPVAQEKAVPPPLERAVPEKPETAVPAPKETAVPPAPRRGRPPKPRCEHGLLLERCPDCSEDMAA
jgi:hypothetical protein